MAAIKVQRQNIGLANTKMLRQTVGIDAVKVQKTKYRHG
jgi:hypothetical protein